MHRLCQTGKPPCWQALPLLLCSPCCKDGNLRCHLLQRDPTLQMKMGTPELLLVVIGRGRKSHRGRVPGSMCSRDAAPAVCKGNAYLCGVACPVPYLCWSTASLQRSRFTTCTLYTRVLLIEGFGAGEEGGGGGLKVVFLFNLGPCVSSKPVNSVG